jgi:predicted PurR-regulated permease PerM
MSTEDISLEQKVINTTIKLGVLVLLLYWCFDIVKPFLLPIVWGAVIAVSVYPLFQILLPKLGNKHAFTGTVITLVMLSILLIPTFMLSSSLFDSVAHISTGLEEGTLKVPPPKENVKEWPLAGEKIYSIWSEFADDLTEAISTYNSQIKAVGKSVLSAVVGGGTGVLQFIISIIIAGVFLANAEKSVNAVKGFLIKLSPKNGASFAKLASATTRSVAQGVVGIGIVQGIFVGLGFWAIDLPGAGLLALIVMVLSIAQIPATIVTLPVIIYVFSLDDISTLTLIIFTVWTVIGGALDGILKPFVMGRGVDAPMLVILIGAIGGMISMGILGLFIGAIVLAIGYILYMNWVSSAGQPDETEVSDDPVKAPT